MTALLKTKRSQALTTRENKSFTATSMGWNSVSIPSDYSDSSDDLSVSVSIPYYKILEKFDIVVSKEFYDSIVSHLSELFIPYNRVYLRLFAYINFSGYTDKETYKIIASQKIIAAICEKTRQLKNGRFSVLAEFEALKRLTGLTISLTNPSYSQEKARTVVLTLPESLEAALERELSNPGEDLYLVSGQKYSRPQRKKAKQQRAQYLSRHPVDQARPNAAALHYLNSLPSNGFKQFQRHLPQARAHVSKVYPIHEGMSRWAQEKVELKRRVQLRILKRLGLDIQPLYRQVENTERLYCVGESLANLHSDLRAILLRGTVSYDLSNCHLATVAAARLWNVPVIEEYLDSYGTIWPLLLDQLNLPAEAKGDLKTAIYASVYGMAESRVKALMTSNLGRQTREAFMAHELVAALFAARQRRMDRIETEGGITDAYGVRHLLRTDAATKERDQELRTLLFKEASSYEFKIMSSVVDLAEKTDDWRISLWLHDGVYVRFSDRSKQERWHEKIIAAVDKTCGHLSVKTRMEVSYGKS